MPIGTGEPIGNPARGVRSTNSRPLRGITIIFSIPSRLATWNEKTELARSKLKMTSHLALLDWWAPTGIEERCPRTPEDASALTFLGIQLNGATLGNPSINVRRSIACFEAALGVFTASDFPSQWANTQNNLGNAYVQLPTGDRGENLRHAIDCFELAWVSPSPTSRRIGR